MDPVKRRTFLKIVGAGSLATIGNIGSSGKVTPVKPVAPTTLKITPKGRAYREFLKNKIVSGSRQTLLETSKSPSLVKNVTKGTFTAALQKNPDFKLVPGIPGLPKSMSSRLVENPSLRKYRVTGLVNNKPVRKRISPSDPLYNSKGFLTGTDVNSRVMVENMRMDVKDMYGGSTNLQGSNQRLQGIITDEARSAYAKQIKLARDKISSAKKPVVAKPVKKRSLLHIVKKIFTKGRG